jgi:UDP-N-acetylmuramate--alanine ligase
LAQYYLAKGHKISGSDLAASEVTDFLEEKGIEIKIGNSENNISSDLDLVVHTPAVKPDNPEYKKAKEEER